MYMHAMQFWLKKELFFTQQTGLINSKKRVSEKEREISQRSAVQWKVKARKKSENRKKNLQIKIQFLRKENYKKKSCEEEEKLFSLIDN